MMVRAFGVVALGLTLAGCGGGSKAQQGPPPLAVDVASAKRQDISTTIVLDGQIAPLQQSTLSSTQSGTVTAVLVNEGDRVTKGQLLAQLDDSQLRAQLAGNEATVQQSEAKLSGSNMQAPISSQQYSSAVSTAEQNLQAAQNRIQTDDAALRNAEMVNTSNQQLVKQGYVAQTAAEQARATYVAAVQELNNARQALPAAQAAMRTAQTNTQQTGIDQATISQNRAALAQAQANVKLLQTQIAQSAIYAPFDGVVTQRLLDPGAFAGPNAPIVQVSELDTVYVNANVPDEDLGFVQTGHTAHFTSPSLPGRTFTGVIADVNATPTAGTLSYRARIRQPNPGGVLRGGMLVSMTVLKEKHLGAIVVPRSAVFSGDQGTNVYTIVDGKAKAVPVEVGLQTDTLAEVRGGGVHPGMSVITTRPDALQDGSVVAVSGDQPSAKTAH
jgi:multidrug efflux pump subunit AcrA (membrane-fusion protein)